MNQLPAYMTKNEVAKALRINPKTLERRSMSGDLPYVKIGRRVLYSLPDVKAYLAKNTVNVRQ